MGPYSGMQSDEYNRMIVENWNNVVSNDDTVYVLGGLGIGDMYDIFFQLHGNIVVLDNFYTQEEEDFKKSLMVNIEKSIMDNLSERVRFDTRQMAALPDDDTIISYFPVSDWYGKNTGTFCFHGLNHNDSLAERNLSCCASKYNLTPVCIADMKERVLGVEMVVSE